MAICAFKLRGKREVGDPLARIFDPADRVELLRRFGLAAFVRSCSMPPSAPRSRCVSPTTGSIGSCFLAKEAKVAYALHLALT